MIKSKITWLFIAGIAGLLISCKSGDTSALDDSIQELQSNQQDILKKIQSIDNSIANLTLANKNRPAKPKADPNKVYSAKIGNSFVHGNKNAKVTIIEWADYY